MVAVKFPVKDRHAVNSPGMARQGAHSLYIIGQLPPSAKLVYRALEAGGQLTQKEIICRTFLPPRTVRYAIGRLRRENVITERFCFRDARQSLYALRHDGAMPVPHGSFVK
jgi:DNA-binding MarR family transcriptional regulator